MTEEQKIKIYKLRKAGLSYGAIAEELGMKRDTVYKQCSRHPQPPESIHCKFCGADIPIVYGRKQPKFCSTKCCRDWWKAHPDSGTRKAYYTIICAGCGQEFQSYGNAGRKYCSHACYINDRFKGGESGDT